MTDGVNLQTCNHFSRQIFHLKTHEKCRKKAILKWFLLTKVLLWSINNLYLLLLISFKEDVVYLNNALKSALSHQQNIFEGMNIRYFGPFDGHDGIRLLRPGMR